MITREIEDWQSFQERLKSFSQKESEDIEWAYQIAKSAHRGQLRDGGERYFEHPRSVSLILLDEVKRRNSRMVIGTLLHDVAEDSAVFGNPLKLPFRAWAEITNNRISRVFDQQTAEIVLAVTKPKVDGETFHTKEEAGHFYLENLMKASSEAKVVKMCDRLHNLRTLGSVTPEKRTAKIKETRDLYYPIFDSARKDYTWDTYYLMGMMERAILELNQVT